MSIELTPEQQKWLEAEVAAGHFGSVEGAARIAIADLKALDADDLSWARPYVEAAQIAAAKAETISLSEHRARMAQRLEALKR